MRPIAFTATSARRWAKLSPDVRSRIDKRLMEFATTGHDDVKRLKGRDGIRHRVGARARKEIAGGGPLLPKDIVDRLANGENPVRVLREWRDVTQMYLSFKTDLSQGHISDIENGRRVGTAAALRLIANVLNVPLDLLVQER